MADIDWGGLSKDELHDLADNAIAELERRTSKFKRQAKPTLLRELRGCRKKVQYERLSTAEKRARKYTEEFGVQNRVYECDICGLWHITTTPTKQRKDNPIDRKM